MDYLLALAGLGIIIWTLSVLFDPPKKHKDFSVRDQQDATHRALGGSRHLDASDVGPPETKRQRRV
jgi:hypothetical protein